jgi:hypothetical protein
MKGITLNKKTDYYNSVHEVLFQASSSFSSFINNCTQIIRINLELPYIK